MKRRSGNNTEQEVFSVSCICPFVYTPGGGGGVAVCLGIELIQFSDTDTLGDGDLLLGASGAWGILVVRNEWPPSADWNLQSIYIGAEVEGIVSVWGVIWNKWGREDNCGWPDHPFTGFYRCPKLLYLFWTWLGFLRIQVTLACTIHYAVQYYKCEEENFADE